MKQFFYIPMFFLLGMMMIFKFSMHFDSRKEGSFQLSVDELCETYLIIDSKETKVYNIKNNYTVMCSLL